MDIQRIIGANQEFLAASLSKIAKILSSKNRATKEFSESIRFLFQLISIRGVSESTLSNEIVVQIFMMLEDESVSFKTKLICVFILSKAINNFLPVLQENFKRYLDKTQLYFMNSLLQTLGSPASCQENLSQLFSPFQTPDFVSRSSIIPIIIYMFRKYHISSIPPKIDVGGTIVNSITKPVLYLDAKIIQAFEHSLESTLLKTPTIMSKDPNSSNLFSFGSSKPNSSLVLEPDGQPSRDFFTILNESAYFSDDQVSHHVLVSHMDTILKSIFLSEKRDDELQNGQNNNHQTSHNAKNENRRDGVDPNEVDDLSFIFRQYHLSKSFFDSLLKYIERSMDQIKLCFQQDPRLTNGLPNNPTMYHSSSASNLGSHQLNSSTGSFSSFSTGGAPLGETKEAREARINRGRHPDLSLIHLIKLLHTICLIRPSLVKRVFSMIKKWYSSHPVLSSISNSSQFLNANSSFSSYSQLMGSTSLGWNFQAFSSISQERCYCLLFISVLDFVFESWDDKSRDPEYIEVDKIDGIGYKSRFDANLIIESELIVKSFFDSFLDTYYQDPVIAFEAMQFLGRKANVLIEKTNLLSHHFRSILKLVAWHPTQVKQLFLEKVLPLIINQQNHLEMMHSLLDLPILTCAQELVKNEFLYGPSPQAVPNQPTSSASEKYRLLFNLLFRIDTGVVINFWDSSSTLSMLKLFWNDVRFTPRLLASCELALDSMEVFLNFFVENASFSSVLALIPSIIERMDQLFPLNVYETQIRSLMINKILAMFSKYPNLIVPIQKLFLDLIADSGSSSSRDDLILHVVWLIGQYANESIVPECKYQVIADYDEALELFAFERMSLVSIHTQEQSIVDFTTPSQIFNARIMMIVISSLTKLAARCQALGQRVKLCLAKVLRYEKHFPPMIIHRAHQCLNILKYPSLASTILDSLHPEDVSQHHIDSHSSLTFLLHPCSNNTGSMKPYRPIVNEKGEILNSSYDDDEDENPNQTADLLFKSFSDDEDRFGQHKLHQFVM